MSLAWRPAGSDNFGDKGFGAQGVCKSYGGTLGLQRNVFNLARLVRGYAVKLILRAAMELQKRLTFASDRATFIVSAPENRPVLSDEREEELRAITERFEQFDRDTVRTDVTSELFARLYVR